MLVQRACDLVRQAARATAEMEGGQICLEMEMAHFDFVGCLLDKCDQAADQSFNTASPLALGYMKLDWIQLLV